MKKDKIVFISLVIVSIIGAFLITNLYVKKQIENENKLYFQEMYYENTNFDFIIPDPTHEQVDEFQGNPLYDNVLPFYFVRGDFYKNANKVTYDIVLIEDKNHLKYTDFNDNLLLSNFKEASNPIWIDLSFSKKAGVKVGDTISLSLSSDVEEEYNIVGIYQDNVFSNDGKVLMIFEGSIKDRLNFLAGDGEVKYGGAYLSALNENRSWIELQDYIPYATLKPREDFETDDAYDAYLDVFYQDNFVNKIQNKGKQYQEDLKEIKITKDILSKDQKIISLISVFAYLVITIILLITIIRFYYSKKLTIEFKQIFKLGMSQIIITNAIFTLSMLVFNIMLTNKVVDFQKIKYFNSMAIKYFILNLLYGAIAVMSSLVVFIILRKNSRRLKKK